MVSTEMGLEAVLEAITLYTVFALFLCAIFLGTLVFSDRPQRVIRRIPPRARAVSVVILFVAVVVNLSWGFSWVLDTPASKELDPSLNSFGATFVQYVPPLLIGVLVSVVLSLLFARILTRDPIRMRIEKFIRTDKED